MFSKIMKNDEICIVDIGASGGIHHRWLQSGINIKAVLFEPDPREYANLCSTLPNNYIAINAALSNKEGEIEFNLFNNLLSISRIWPS